MSTRVSWCHCALGVWMAFIPCRPALAQSSAPVKESAPIDPAVAILDAFHTHRLVALGEDHGALQAYAFRMALIHHPEFAGLVNDIVVEAGNSLYQDVMDKFVAGEEVPYDALRRVWQDTTQTLDVWDKPINEEFYRAIRALNSGLPKERRLRVLLGDPPIDWASVHTAGDLRSWMGPDGARRDTYPTELIRREVLARSRRALIVYGGLHLQRHDYLRNYEPSQGIVEALERDAPGSVFSIWMITEDLQAAQPSVSSWPNPSLAILRGTLLGAQDFTFYYPSKVTVRDKDGNPLAPGARRHLRMEDQFDAVLYLGPKSSLTYSSLPAALCQDQDYVKMRLARMKLSFPGPPPPGFPPPGFDVRRECEDALANGWSPRTAPE